MSQKNEEPQSTLHRLAGRVHDEFGFGDEAISHLEELILKDKAALRQAARDSAEAALRHRMSLERAKIIRSAPSHDESPRRYSREMQEAVGNSAGKYLGFLDWPMSNGVRLAKADRELVSNDAEQYRKLAEGNGRNSRFLSMVLGKLKPGQVVEEVFSEEELSRLMDRAKK